MGGIIIPQLSLYIEDDTLKTIETQAKIVKLSVSKFVSAILKEHLNNTWPPDFQNIFGSIKDDSFLQPASIAFSMDAEREAL